jgi:hypothetical protein
MKINISKGRVSFHNWIILTVLLLICTKVQAQASAPSEVSLIGSWVMDATSSLSGMTSEDRQLLDASPQLSSQILTEQINRKLTFDPNGNFSQMDGTGNKMEGNWRLQEQTLTITSINGNLWVSQVLQVSQTQLALQQSEKGEALPLLPVLYFIRTQ